MDTHCDTSSKKEDFADILAVLVVIIKNEKKKVVDGGQLGIAIRKYLGTNIKIEGFLNCFERKSLLIRFYPNFIATFDDLNLD